jgi:hypothetical protein
MRHRVQQLGDINRACSTHLLKNFEREGIAHWWTQTGAETKGAAVFAYYDPISTCLRVMPGAPRFFQAAFRNGLLSPNEASDLSRTLLTVLDTLLVEYSGYFLEEIRQSRFYEDMISIADTDDFSLHEAHHNLAPDDIYAQIPWPLMPGLHFKLSKFSPAGIRGNYIANAARHPLRAINIAVEIASLGPSISITAESIRSVLGWLGKPPRARNVDELASFESVDLQKVVIPAFNAGFQGIVFGVFRSLPETLQPFVINQLQQFASTIGEHLAYHREQELASALERAQNLNDYARAFMAFLPPVEHAVFGSDMQMLGFRTCREVDYLAGYQPIERAAIDAAFDDPENEIIEPHGLGSKIRIRIKMLGDAAGLSPTFTIMRLRPRLSIFPSLSTDETKSLSRVELASIYHSLRRQVLEGRGAITACKKLYLIDAVIQHFDEGEVSLSNNKARDFLQRILGKPIAGYHVAGKAAKRFEAEIEKLAPERFVFEMLSTHSLRVRWHPKIEQYKSQNSSAMSHV